MMHTRALQAGHASPPAMSVSAPSVLVMAHSHPRLTRGGAEISAYALFRQMRARGTTCWFLGCGGKHSETRLGAALTQPYGADDYLYTPATHFDYFKFANQDPHFPGALAGLVAELRPDIVHAHHYVRFGVEMFAVIKRASPTTRIVLSLHEYLGICNNHGQMVKTVSGRLCQRASLADCAACFPAFSAADFFLRRRYIQTHLADVDVFLAPSHFLAERYAAWGLPASRIAVLENMPPDSDLPDAPPPSTTTLGNDTGAETTLRRPVRFGFFGQMSPLKGITVLIEAARLLDGLGAGNVSIDIHGDYSNQPPAFQDAVRADLAAAGANIAYHGPYENTQVQSLMAQVDAVIVPSIWWENSPVVIQEAYAAGRPVICSNIGGMAEKVRPGLDGLHFEAGRPASLASVLAGIAARPDILAGFAATLARPAGHAAALDAHLAAYALAAGAGP